jgi:DNA-binding transcriptional LysR family regulator
VVGRTLVVRGKGGGVEMTAQGTALVERGRALLALNDDILKAVQAQPANAAVRLGVDSWYSRRLPDILALLAATHPHVTVEVARAASCELGPMLKANTLDLMLCAVRDACRPGAGGASLQDRTDVLRRLGVVRSGAGGTCRIRVAA